MTVNHFIFHSVQVLTIFINHAVKEVKDFSDNNLFEYSKENFFNLCLCFDHFKRSEILDPNSFLRYCAFFSHRLAFRFCCTYFGYLRHDKSEILPHNPKKFHITCKNNKILYPSKSIELSIFGDISAVSCSRSFA